MGKNNFNWCTISCIFRTFFFSTYVVEGKSMMPTLQDGNMLVVNKVSYQVGDLNRFDVVVFHANKKEDYVKRIIGLPVIISNISMINYI